MNYLIAPDSFKGTMTSEEICDITERAILDVLPSSKVIKLPVADGGEGLVRAFVTGCGATEVTAEAVDPYGKPIFADYAMLDGRTAVIEMAACAGLPLVGDNKNPAATTTYGVGMLIKHAADNGAEEVILGLGGSATNDCGIGMAAALGFRFLDVVGNEVNPVGGSMSDIEKIISPENPLKIKAYAACDVDNPLFGKNGAAYVFAPQKGADPKMVKQLDGGLKHISEIIKKDLHIDISEIKGAGAAGGMGGGAAAFIGCELRSGIDLILDKNGFDSMLEKSDVVITGEGSMDGQSVHGKTPCGVAMRAKKHGKPCIAICGRLGDGAEKMHDVGVTEMYATSDGTQDEATIKNTCRKALYDTVTAVMRAHH